MLFLVNGSNTAGHRHRLERMDHTAVWWVLATAGEPGDASWAPLLKGPVRAEGTPVDAVTWALCGERGRPGLRLLTARHECLPEIEQARGSHDGGDSEAAEREPAPDAVVAHHLWIPRDQHHQDQRDRCLEPAGDRADEEQLDWPDAE